MMREWLCRLVNTAGWRWVLVLLFIPAEAFARAGGGGGYHGGGGGGGGHGGGGGGGFGGGGGGGGSHNDGLVWLVIQLLFRHPTVGVPVLIVVAVLFLSGRKQ